MNAEVERLRAGQSEWQERARLLQADLERLRRDKSLAPPEHLNAEIERADVRERVELWFKSRTKEYQRQVFDKYATLGSLAREKLSSCLSDLGIKLADANVFDQLDINNDGVLCFEEFQRFVQHKTPLRGWVSNMPVADLLSALLAHALPFMG